MEGRRRFRRTLVGVVAALLLAAGACSDDGAGSEADDTASTASSPATRPLTEEETLALDADVLGSEWTAEPYYRPVAEEDDDELEVCLGRETASEHEVSTRFSDRFVHSQGSEALASVIEVDDPDVAAAALEAYRAAGADCLADLYRAQAETDVAGTGTTADIDGNVIPLPGADDALRIRLTVTITSDEGQIPTRYLDLVLAVDGVHEVSVTSQSSVSPVPDDLQVRLLEAARDAI